MRPMESRALFAPIVTALAVISAGDNASILMDSMLISPYDEILDI